MSFIAYNILNNNYFKLRDIGEAFDFSVEWDNANNAININTDFSYSAHVSPVSFPQVNSIYTERIGLSFGELKKLLIQPKSEYSAHGENVVYETNIDIFYCFMLQMFGIMAM